MDGGTMPRPALSEISWISLPCYAAKPSVVIVPASLVASTRFSSLAHGFFLKTRDRTSWSGGCVTACDSELMLYDSRS
jgi:hypothetical protein